MITLMAELLRFVATVARQGNMRVIIIPKDMHEKIKKHEGKQVKVVLEEI